MATHLVSFVTMDGTSDHAIWHTSRSGDDGGQPAGLKPPSFVCLRLLRSSADLGPADAPDENRTRVGQISRRTKVMYAKLSSGTGRAFLNRRLPALVHRKDDLAEHLQDASWAAQRSIHCAIALHALPWPAPSASTNVALVVDGLWFRTRNSTL